MEFLSDCIVKVMDSSLKVLDNWMAFMFKLIHDKTHVEETSRSHQVHHLNIFTGFHAEEFLNFDGSDDLLDD